MNFCLDIHGKTVFWILLHQSPKSLIYKGFGRCALASLARFERAAFRLGGECSIQLSYGDILEYVCCGILEGVGRRAEKVAGTG